MKRAFYAFIALCIGVLASMLVFSMPASAHDKKVSANCSGIEWSFTNYQTKPGTKDKTERQCYWRHETKAANPGSPAIYEYKYKRSTDFVWNHFKNNKVDFTKCKPADWNGNSENTGWVITSERCDDGHYEYAFFTSNPGNGWTKVMPEVKQIKTPAVPATPAEYEYKWSATDPGNGWDRDDSKECKTVVIEEGTPANPTPNSYSVVVDGNNIAGGNFGTSVSGSWVNPDKFVSHSYTVTVAGWDGYDGTWSGTIAACEIKPTPTETTPPADEEVTPVAPTFVAPDCDTDGTVTVPEDTDAIDYQVTGESPIVIVDAVAKEGYVIKEGANKHWSYNIAATGNCPPSLVTVTPVMPEIVAATCTDDAHGILPVTNGIIYSYVDANTVQAVPAMGYRFANDAPYVTFELGDLSKLNCVTPVAPETEAPDCGIPTNLILPKTEGILYTKAPLGDDYHVVVTATAKPGYTITPGSVTSWTIAIEDAKVCEEPTTPPVTEKPTPKPDTTIIVVPGDDIDSLPVTSPDDNSNGVLAVVVLVVIAAVGAGLYFLRRRS